MGHQQRGEFHRQNQRPAFRLYSCLDHLAVVSMTTEKLFLNINQVCQTYTCALHLLKARKAILRPKADKLIHSMKTELPRI